MKTADTMRKICFAVLFCIGVGIFVFSCGMEVVYSISEPMVTYNNPLYSSSDPLTWYFSFKTAAESDNSDLSFNGTDVYYRIYNNYSSLNSQRNAILSVNSESNGNAAATRMIDTYKFQQLGTSTQNDKAVFFEGHNNSRVILRLKNYQNGISSTSAGYEELMKNRYTLNACVGYYANSEASGYTYESYIPYRNSAVGAKSFDFFDYDSDNTDGTRDVEPVSGDSDYEYSSTFSESDCYYVQLFAVSRAWNTNTVSPVYSLVLDLGSVPIRKGE